MSSPAIKLRDGCLSVVIWRNPSDTGPYYTCNPQRSYRTGEDAWKETDSLSQDSLLAMAELLREAYAWIRMQKRADAAGRKQAEQVTAK